MRRVKSVSFNLHDPHEKELYERANLTNTLTGKSRNFSDYVKRLIENDIRGIPVVPTYQAPPVEDKEKVKAMSSFM